MSKTIVQSHQSDIHVNNNTMPRLVIKDYDDTVETTPAPKVGVSFEKPTSEPAVEPTQATTTTETTTPEPQTDAERIAARRSEFKKAADIERRAMQMQKEAESKLAKARHFEEVAAKAKTDPIEVAKALGMDPTEFLRLYQNKMFNIETPKPEVTLTPEQEVKQRLDKYESERKTEQQQAMQYQSQLIKQNYISNKIMPVIQANEELEILKNSNLDMVTGFMYDMMNDHFMRTGEELDPKDVAEEMENQFLTELETKIKSAKNIKKLSKHFKEELAEAQAQLEQQVQSQPPAKTKVLGATDKTKTISDMQGISVAVPLTPQQPGRSSGSREDRLRKIAQKFGR